MRQRSLLTETGEPNEPSTEVPGDSAGWIPLEPEEVEEPDSFEDRLPARGVGIRADWRRGSMEVRRLWGKFSWPVDGEVAWLHGPDAPPWVTARVGHSGRAGLAIGEIVVRRGPVLLMEAVGLSRPSRSPAGPRLPAPSFEAPRGVSSLVARGGAGSASVGPLEGWIVGGRGGEGEALLAVGITSVWGPRRMALGAGRRGTRRAISMASRFGGDGAQAAFEALLSPGRGPEVLFEASRRAEPLEFRARWRRRPGEARPVAGELSVETSSRALRSRLSWRPWSARAAEDDGKVEMETVVRRAALGPARLRVGARAGARGERYAIADIVVAQEGGRTFTLIASGRESRRAGGAGVASTLGSRFEWSDPRRLGASVLLQASRARIGSGVPAWAVATAPSGDELLVARGRAGLLVTGRAWMRLGRLRIEGLLSESALTEGDRPAEGTIRLEWLR